MLDRTNGRLLHATPFANVTWGSVDRATGKVTPSKIPTRAGALICPGPAGAKEWPHAAYSARTGLLYAPVIEQCATYRTFRTEFHESMPYWGGDAQADKVNHAGFIKSIDPMTGREAWSWKTDHPVVGSVLTTGGDLVFAGLATGEFVALDAKRGTLLWRFQTGSGIHSSPTTYSLNGRQFVAVASGWGGWMKGYAPELYGGNRGNALFAFALSRAQ